MANDLVLIGSGFASAFFLKKYLEHAGPRVRVVVLERGHIDSLAWQIEHQRSSQVVSEDHYTNRTPEKPWRFTLGFGGGSNCWWACTPRFMPNDFRLQSTYGVGRDWPIGYEDLEPYYEEAEQIMSVSGPHPTPYPKSGPYPLPPHRLTDADEQFQKHYPDSYFVQPTARASVDTESRPRCCGNGVCSICPVNAKFTILNGMLDVLMDDRVELRFGATARSVETVGTTARAVVYEQDGQESRVEGDLIAVGANAVFNPYLLQRSGLDHPKLGRNLHEQISQGVILDLDGVDHYNGSTSINGHGYMFYDGDHRSHRPAALIESSSIPHLSGALRAEPGKWLQRMSLKFIFEELPQVDNRVEIDTDDPTKPTTSHSNYSDYALRGIRALPELVEKLIGPLPIENYRIADKVNPTEAHVMGTCVMSSDPSEGIVDDHLIHHKVRNLLVLGSSAFPTCSPANPTLTLSALSLRSADHLFGKA
jgi:choline dehydrogenase-like flavoprotein